MDASDPALTRQYFQGEDEDQGWMSWAWSFVPAIVSTEEEEEEEGESGFYTDTAEPGAARPLQNAPRDPVVSVGFYCTKASVTFKVSGKSVSVILCSLAPHLRRTLHAVDDEYTVFSVLSPPKTLRVLLSDHAGVSLLLKSLHLGLYSQDIRSKSSPKQQEFSLKS